MKRNPIVSGDAHFHGVRFYKDSLGLSEIVGNFLAEGFAHSQPAMVIATPLHRLAVESQLTTRGFDVTQLTSGRMLKSLDADAVLEEFMVDGVPDAMRFKRAIVPVLESVCEGRDGCVVRAYGEMVDVLWKRGQFAAATRLETLWNALANTHQFSLLCGYAMGNFYKDAAVEQICSH